MSERKKSRAASSAGARRTQTHFWTAAAIAVLVGVGATGVYLRWGMSAEMAYADRVKRGQVLYAQNCASCHGQNGVGENPREVQGGLKPTGGYWAPALDSRAHAWHHPPDALFDIIKKGSPASDSQMKGWAGRLSDEDIRSLVAYMNSLWPPPLQARYRQAFGYP